MVDGYWVMIDVFMVLMGLGLDTSCRRRRRLWLSAWIMHNFIVILNEYVILMCIHNSQSRTIQPVTYPTPYMMNFSIS